MVTRFVEIRRPARDLDREIFFGFDIIDAGRVMYHAVGERLANNVERARRVGNSNGAFFSK